LTLHAPPLHTDYTRYFLYSQTLLKKTKDILYKAIDTIKIFIYNVKYKKKIERLGFIMLDIIILLSLIGMFLCPFLLPERKCICTEMMFPSTKVLFVVTWAIVFSGIVWWAACVADLSIIF